MTPPRKAPQPAAVALRAASLARTRSERIAAALFALNAANNVDAVATLAGVLGGVIDEGNPIMAGALLGGPIAFLAAKLGLVTLATWALWLARRHRWTLRASYAVAGVVGVVSLSHAAWVLPLLF